MDARQQLLQDWLPSALARAHRQKGWGKVRSARLLPASTDASFRRYFRWSDGERSLIIMDAPPPQEDVRPFLRIGELLA